MDNTAANISAARRYLAAIEAGASGPTLAEYFTPDIEFVGMPNRLSPEVVRQDLAGMLKASERGQQVIARQTYEVRSALAGGERVALEVEWSGTLKIPLGTLPAGGVMRAHFAMFLDFRDGKIAVQRNYDCFEPF